MNKKHILIGVAAIAALYYLKKGCKCASNATGTAQG